MHTQEVFPSLEGWEPTRDSLHEYVRVVCAVPRALAEPHPLSWHVSLKLKSDLLWTDAIHHPALAEQALQLYVDLQSNLAGLSLDGEAVETYSLDKLPDAAGLAQAIGSRLAALGIDTRLEFKPLTSDGPRAYDPAHAQSFLAALQLTYQVQSQVKVTLEGETGPIQLWPFNFDQAFEWFSGRTIEQGDGQTQAQINFGFAPGDRTHPRPYFYSNPSPMDTRLTNKPLASGARWFESSWQGTLLDYDQLVNVPGGPALLEKYFQSVYMAASPMLRA